jgi:hypothetical protein
MQARARCLRTKPSLPGVSRALTALSLIIILVVAFAAYHFVFSGQTAPSAQTAASTADLRALNQTYAALAFAHWASIAQKNLTAVMSQYSTQYEALWWYVNSSAPLGPSNGKHDCNVPTGQVNCSSVLSEAWQQFFDNVSSTMKLSVCGFTSTLGVDGNGYSRAGVAYYIGASNETILVPYEIDFRAIGGQWQLQRDWFGLSGDFATLQPGDVPPACH